MEDEVKMFLYVLLTVFTMERTEKQTIEQTVSSKS